MVLQNVQGMFGEHPSHLVTLPAGSSWSTPAPRHPLATQAFPAGCSGLTLLLKSRGCYAALLYFADEIYTFGKNVAFEPTVLCSCFYAEIVQSSSVHRWQMVFGSR